MVWPRHSFEIGSNLQQKKKLLTVVDSEKPLELDFSLPGKKIHAVKISGDSAENYIFFLKLNFFLKFAFSTPAGKPRFSLIFSRGRGRG